MKVKCLVACNGIGYENLKVGEERTVKKDIAETLISFGYADRAEVLERKPPKEAPEESPKNNSKTNPKKEQAEP